MLEQVFNIAIKDTSLFDNKEFLFLICLLKKSEIWYWITATILWEYLSINLCKYMWSILILKQRIKNDSYVFE